MASIGVADGIGPERLKYIYFDAHDDLYTPSTTIHGYFDALGLPILSGESLHAMAKTIPGFQIIDYQNRFLCVGIRDCTEVDRQPVREHNMDAIWASATEKVDCVGELSERLEKKSLSPVQVHLDLQVLDKSHGMVNGFKSAGGLSKNELVKYSKLLPQKANRSALAVCSFDANLYHGDKIADIAARSISSMISSMIEQGQLAKS